MDPYERDVEEWRANRLARLTAPDGWLTVVGLSWLHAGENTIGSDPASDVVLPPSAPPRVGVIEVADGAAVARLDPGAGVTDDTGGPIGTLALRDDTTGVPTVLRLGAITFHVIARDGALAVRVRDEESPARRDFAGIEHFPVDARWRIDAAFEPREPPGRVEIPTVLGTTETYLLSGRLMFEIDGAAMTLDALLEQPDGDLFIVFADATNQDETYGGGRFLYARPPSGDGPVVVDFNRAYNPPCVFTPHATCPLPPPQNRLPVRVTAGEKRYRGTPAG